MALARDVRLSMVGHDHKSSRVMVQNYDLLQRIMSYGSIGIGSTTGAWSAHLRELETLLKEVEALMKRWRSGALTNDQFFAQRQVLFPGSKPVCRALAAWVPGSTTGARSRTWKLKKRVRWAGRMCVLRPGMWKVGGLQVELSDLQ